MERKKKKVGKVFFKGEMVIRGKTTRDFWKRIRRRIATRGRRVEGADARGVLSSIQEFSGFIPEHSHLCIFPFFIAFFSTVVVFTYSNSMF